VKRRVLQKNEGKVMERVLEEGNVGTCDKEWYQMRVMREQVRMLLTGE
jgi:hypothetical protein